VVKLGGLYTLYYIGGANRYVFPNSQTYFTWYDDFSHVKTVTTDELKNHPLSGTNITYRAGKRLIKITTDPKVYAVSSDGVLRWITTEEIAEELYGENWASYVDDLPDVFFRDYDIGSPIESADDYDKETEMATDLYPLSGGAIAD